MFCVAALLALNEAFYNLFYRFYSFWWFRLIFPSAVLVMLSSAICRGFVKPLAHARALMSVVASVDSAVSLIEAGTFIMLMLLAAALHVRWRKYPCCIALGFAMAGMGDLATYVLLSRFGAGYRPLTKYLAPIIYICATLLWVWCFGRKLESEPKLE